MTEPKISAICITYGRRRMLEEALESFLRQDYPNKELIILNDEPLVYYEFDHPQVLIFNYQERFTAIGEKRNYATDLSTGDYLLPWDDDDIYLPNRMSFCYETLMKGNKHFGHYQHTAVATHKDCVIKKYLMGSNCMYSRQAFYDIGRYDESIVDYKKVPIGEDHDLANRLKAVHKRSLVPVHYKDIFYIYRWGRSPHLSFTATMREHQRRTDEESVSEKGSIKLAPVWRQDYTDILSVRV